MVQLSHQKRRCIQWFIDITHNQVKPTLHIDKMIDEKGCVMRSLFKKFIAIMTLSTIFITSANAVYVYRYQQEKTQWCWAASAQMIGHTLGRQVTQTDIVTQVKGMDINDGANDTEMKMLLHTQRFATPSYDHLHGLLQVLLMNLVQVNLS